MTSNDASSPDETLRLEYLWRDEFGEDYIERNIDAGEKRAVFWSKILSRVRPASILEIGANVGGNVQHLSGDRSLVCAAVDVNHSGLRILKERHPRVLVAQGTGRALPFRSATFDLVFTVGVLIHIADESLDTVLDEMVRCSKRNILIAEYHSDQRVEVPYRGQQKALFKRDYAGLFATRFPEHELVESGHLSEDEGFDDVTYHLFRAPR